MVSSLRRAGLPGPDPFAGDVTKALAKAGLFRLRSVLIGSVAFSTYAEMLGVRLPAAAMQTGDADFAQDFAISGEVRKAYRQSSKYYSRSTCNSRLFRIRQVKPE